MTLDDRDALNALNRRLGHIVGTARIVAETARLDGDTIDAVYVIGEALEVAWDQLGAILAKSASGGAL